MLKPIHWELFGTLSSDLISPRIQIDTVEGAEKAAYNFTASVISAHRMSTYKLTLSELNNELPGLDRLLQHKQGLTKLWHVTKDTAVKRQSNRSSRQSAE
jgi:hypothetical protein